MPLCNVRQGQAISCSRITQHATVKSQPNRRPDAAWTSDPAKYLPKKTEIQTPEAAAAAKETIKKVLESRICDSTINKSHGSSKSNQPTTKSASSVSENNPSADNRQRGAQIADVADPARQDGYENAAKERFMNALARFQINAVAKSG